MEKDRIIVKIGSESLKNFGTSEKVQSLIETIAKSVHEGTQILLVTSGAVQFGRDHTPGIENKQVLAAVGWPYLISSYTGRFAQQNIGVASFLVTHADIEDSRDRAKTFIETIQATWDAGLLPIVNENDPISTEEMREVGRGADNDRNALLLAKLFKTEMIILITNTDGVYANTSDPDSRIQRIDSSTITEEYISSLCNGKSSNGTGGMGSKLSVAYEAGKIGITTHIGDGTHSGIYNQDTHGTTIFPRKK